ncbi:hypothetical protein OG338_09620 [Streptomyces sp. NBC_00726]
MAANAATTTKAVPGRDSKLPGLSVSAQAFPSLMEGVRTGEFDTA